jgi:hypothetical protein
MRTKIMGLSAKPVITPVSRFRPACRSKGAASADCPFPAHSGLSTDPDQSGSFGGCYLPLRPE